MAGSLKGRLARLRAAKSAEELGLVRAAALVAGSPSAETARQGTRGPRDAPPPFLAGWEEAADSVWVRELRRSIEFPESIDARPFLPLGLLARGGTRHGASPPAPIPRWSLPAGALRFFDLETTGLSGGSGTVAFLAALGRFDESEFVVTQFFLDDYPGERAWLERILGGFPPNSVAVTYNGRSFDMPLLRSRCVMNGIALPDLAHIDVLTCSRRLWRRVLGGASLGTVERELLGIERAENVPGELIPEIWFSFLRHGEAPLMGAAMSHNADDVASLARIVARIHDMYDDPLRWSSPRSVDLGSFGRSLFALGRGEEGAALLESALRDGDEDAGLRLARAHRRAGRIDELRELVHLLPQSFRSCVERAKFYEHVDRDWAQALQWTGRAQRLAETDDESEALRLRRRRLEARLSARRQ